jgi:hypothetical protein
MSTLLRQKQLGFAYVIYCHFSVGEVSSILYHRRSLRRICRSEPRIIKEIESAFREPTAQKSLGEEIANHRQADQRGDFTEGVSCMSRIFSASTCAATAAPYAVQCPA